MTDTDQTAPEREAIDPTPYDPKPYVVYGRGFSGDYETREEAESVNAKWHARNLGGAIYTRLAQTASPRAIDRPKLEYEEAIIDSLGSYLTDQLNKHGIKVEWAGMRKAIQRECDRQIRLTQTASPRALGMDKIEQVVSNHHDKEYLMTRFRAALAAAESDGSGKKTP